MNQGNEPQFFQVGRVGANKAYAHLTPIELRDLQVYLKLERVTQQRLVTRLLRTWLEESRKHYADIAQGLQEMQDENEDRDC